MVGAARRIIDPLRWRGMRFAIAPIDEAKCFLFRIAAVRCYSSGGPHEVTTVFDRELVCHEPIRNLVEAGTEVDKSMPAIVGTFVLPTGRPLCV